MAGSSRNPQRKEGDIFDHWIRLATDNKINAANSWNVALIDYFHDLSFLREGDGINFQKASATLDGCVKIYSSRVDSAASETGKLLSGLTSGASRALSTATPDDNQEEEEEEEGENQAHNTTHVNTRPKKHAEATLAKGFEALRAKQLDKELLVDPLFKKVLADFDEGGSKALLLNLLRTDVTGRVRFAEEERDPDRLGLGGAPEVSLELQSMPPPLADPAGVADDAVVVANIEALGQRFFADALSLLELAVCPSMASVEEVLQNNDLTRLLEGVESLCEPQEAEFEADMGGERHGTFYDDDDDDDDDVTNLSGPNNTMQRLFDESFQRDTSPVHVDAEIPDRDILAYFDYTLRKNWAGPEHWKIQSLKKPPLRATSAEPAAKKERFRINFIEPEATGDLFQQGSNLLLPKSHWVSHSRHTLPHDIEFSTRRLVHLFHKPTIIRTVSKRAALIDGVADEAFWASDYQAKGAAETLMVNRSRLDLLRDDMHEIHQSFDHTYISNNPNTSYLLNDESGAFDGTDWDFRADMAGEEGQGYSDQMVSVSQQVKPAMLSFARVVKRVDIRLLKANMWACLNSKPATIPKARPQLPSMPVTDPQPIRFSTVLQTVVDRYDPGARRDISTSFLFICLLHLAAENDVELASEGHNQDVLVMRQ